MQTPNELMPDGLQMDLLWENASPTSEFAEQTISLNLSNYKMFVIKTLPYLALENIATHVCCFGDNLLMHFINTMRRRQIDIYDNGILFYDAISVNSYGGSDSTYNKSVIPYQIYGVK